MTKHLRSLMMAVVLVATAGACGDDSDAGGSSGGGGTSGGKAGSGAGSKVTPEQAAAGMCEMMGGGMESCTGIEEYSACVQKKCGIDKCFESECKDLLECTKMADDPCEAMCSPSAECQTCITATASCALNECFSLLMCGGTTGGGMTEEGGACDQLDACCANQPEGADVVCKQAASGARAAGGDSICESAKTAFCMQ